MCPIHSELIEEISKLSKMKELDLDNFIKMVKPMNWIDGGHYDYIKKMREHVSQLSTKKQIELCLKVLEHVDLTSLKGTESHEEITELCEKAAKTYQKGKKTWNTAAVCVTPNKAQDAIKALDKLNMRDSVKVASVAGDFPAASLPLEDRLAEIRLVVEYGVDEVDIVINRKLAIDHKWTELYDELKQVRQACGNKKMKTILAVGDLPGYFEIYFASIIAMLAGTDFIKTSTGKEAINAELKFGLIMCHAIIHYHTATGRKVGLKPAGGISSPLEAATWLEMTQFKLGTDWMKTEMFRIGASKLVDKILEFVDTEFKSTKDY
ncbi:unnamed protein product [Trichogramma brassicae]|uniref:deoxyribose-phosphate aldolase n=1 Tax=Trichogramma brassicae TaxID=86971 RepID=A0A6H5I812_9HYME|nr:unnamed protein product [Trichogramma brassicae]